MDSLGLVIVEYTFLFRLTHSANADECVLIPSIDLRYIVGQDAARAIYARNNMPY